MAESRIFRNPVVIVAVIAALIGAAWLAFGYFGIHTAFVDDKVDEALPTFESGAIATPAAADATQAEEREAIADPTVDGSEPADPAGEPSAGSTGPTIITAATGTFIDRSHPTSGEAVVLTDGTDQRFLRFENFATDNGPDLNVYLSTAPADAPADQFDDDFVDLGALSGNIGTQNYEIPADVDLSRYRTVVIWCVRFGVAFGSADLT